MGYASSNSLQAKIRGKYIMPVPTQAKICAKCIMPVLTTQTLESTFTLLHVITY